MEHTDINLFIKSKICLFIKLVERPNKSMTLNTLDIFFPNFSEHFGNIIFSTSLILYIILS